MQHTQYVRLQVPKGTNRVECSEVITSAHALDPEGKWLHAHIAPHVVSVQFTLVTLQPSVLHCHPLPRRYRL